MRRALVLAGALGLAACGCGRPAFTCDRNAQCDTKHGGVCDVETQRCAYPDDACSDLRFGDYAGAVSGVCLEPVAPDVAFAWRQHEPVELDGDPTELRRGRGYHVGSDFGVSGTVWMSWDNQALYVGADIVDPNLESVAYRGQPLWHHDGLELLFDTANDRASGRIPHADDFKFVVTALNRQGTSWGGIDPTEAWQMAVRSATVVDGTVNQASDRDTGYTVELAVPWDDTFRRPTAGAAWGMNFKVNDHFGPRGRMLVWNVSGRFNYPSNAGTLVFADEARPAVPSEPGPPIAAAPKYVRVDLSERVTRSSQSFLPEQPLAHLFDGCVESQADCSAAAEVDGVVELDIDLGADRDLGLVRLHGDDRGRLISTTWGMFTRTEGANDWSSEWAGEDAHGARWFSQDLRGTTARYLRFRIIGRPDVGLEAAELEVYARSDADVSNLKGAAETPAAGATTPP